MPFVIELLGSKRSALLKCAKSNIIAVVTVPIFGPLCLAQRSTPTPRQWLADGPVKVDELQKLAREAGIDWRTFKDAKSDLGVIADKPNKMVGQRSWQLPAKE